MENKESEKKEFYTDEKFGKYFRELSNGKAGMWKFKNFLIHADYKALILENLLRLEVKENELHLKNHLLVSSIVELAKDENNYDFFINDFSTTVGYSFIQHIDVVNIEKIVDFKNKNTVYLEKFYKDMKISQTIYEVFVENSEKPFIVDMIVSIAKQFEVSYCLQEFVYGLEFCFEADIQLLDLICDLFFKNMENMYKGHMTKKNLVSWLEVVDEKRSRYDETEAIKASRDKIASLIKKLKTLE